MLNILYAWALGPDTCEKENIGCGLITIKSKNKEWINK